ncbi:uncharacterized protein SETTUDRAFT_96879 [Exserohilum turcica Et28A]|uniref:FAD-binding PCMH-type domain-containing protein n=1 Tax=Exserohilum turcicum (strain 28A) TaxID=671987 RepID=R0K1C0_EXST2|nr:uncharacterized protein SETTUDRAFT_96879 [Exserohilum turcica Et28A]EOA82207.1 hypothetical protein SETTUDRAFT_96879 [Exserohilum turcica Et28A]
MGNAVSSLGSTITNFSNAAAAAAAAAAANPIPPGSPPSAAVQHCLSSAIGKGTVAFSGSSSYVLKDVRPYNLDRPIIPAAVTYPTTNEEVAAIVKCAVDNALKVQPRSGGHSYGNYCLGEKSGDTIVVDLKAFQQFSMDHSTWRATIGAGTLLGDIDQKLHINGGRAIAHGTSPTIGIGGHATIGGLGPGSRMWGLALDHIEEMTVVLANSTIVCATPKHNSEVFFAMKGAGSGFGIATQFKMRTEPEPGNAVVYSYTIDAGSTAEKANAFKQWQKLISDPQLSRKFASQFTLAVGVGAIIKGTFFGTQQEYEALNISSRLQTGPASLQLKDWLGVLANSIEEAALSAMGNTPAHFYAKSLPYTKNDLLSDATIDKMFNYIDTANNGGALWFMVWDLEAGAISDVAPDATAYGHRDALFFHQSYAVNITGQLSDTSRNYLAGLNNLVLDSRSGRDNGAYPGYVDPGLGSDAQHQYWGDNVAKLQRIKSRIDPKNVFSNLQSVRPVKMSAKKL